MVKINKFIVNKNFVNIVTFFRQYQQIKRQKFFRFTLSKKKKLILIPRFKQINFEDLLLFYIVVTSGSINLASEQLRLSQPAISLSLQKVEQELGYLLFKKPSSTKSLSLTIYGSILYNYIERIFQLFNEIVNFNSKFFSNSLNVFENFIESNFNQSSLLLLGEQYRYRNNQTSSFKLKSYFLFPMKIESIRFQSPNFKIISKDSIEINTSDALKLSKSIKLSPILC